MIYRMENSFGRSIQEAILDGHERLYPDWRFLNVVIGTDMAQRVKFN